MINRNTDSMHCLHCMSKEVRRQRISGWQWLLAPLMVPVMCNRCLTRYYYPRVLLYWQQLHHRVLD